MPPPSSLSPVTQPQVQDIKAQPNCSLMGLLEHCCHGNGSSGTARAAQVCWNPHAWPRTLACMAAAQQSDTLQTCMWERLRERLGSMAGQTEKGRSAHASSATRSRLGARACSRGPPRDRQRWLCGPVLRVSGGCNGWSSTVHYHLARRDDRTLRTVELCLTKSARPVLPIPAQTSQTGSHTLHTQRPRTQLRAFR